MKGWMDDEVIQHIEADGSDDVVDRGSDHFAGKGEKREGESGSSTTMGDHGQACYEKKTIIGKWVISVHRFYSIFTTAT